MDQLQLLASALGLSALAGIRLYATVLIVGAVIRLGWFQLPQSMQGLSILADTRVLVAAAAFTLIEFLSDKVPWIDSAWDSFHTFVRPIGAVLLSGALGSQLDPAWQTLLMILSGTVALSTHGAKAATRLTVNHSPEPVSNLVLSAAEDLLVPAGIWLTLSHPYVMLAIVVTLLLVTAWLAPKVWRLFRLETSALFALVRTWFRDPVALAGPEPSNPVDRFLYSNSYRTENLPPLYAAELRKRNLASGPALRAAGTRSVKAPGSLGYLVFTPDSIVFIAKRAFGFQVTPIPTTSIRDLVALRGLLLDRLEIQTRDAVLTVDLLKSAANPAALSAPVAATA
jgi:uncharacterized membrane protein